MVWPSGGRAVKQGDFLLSDSTQQGTSLDQLDTSINNCGWKIKSYVPSRAMGIFNGYIKYKAPGSA